MGSTERREVAVPKYFVKDPDKPSIGGNIVRMVLGGLVAIIGLAFAGDSGTCAALGLVVGLVIVGVGVAGYFSAQSKYQAALAKTQPKPSDAQMDAWLAEDKQRFQSEALDKLDLLPDQILGDPSDPILVIGPRRGAMLQLGEDGIIRFSAHDMVIVYLTDYHLAAYQCEFDFGDGRVLTESTKEYHYTDVVSVSTQTEASDIFAVMVDGKEKPIARMQKFALSVASGEKIEVAIAFPQAEDILKNGRMPPTGAEKAISTIRAMLREKKGGVHA